MQNDWWTGLAERTQRYADMGDMRAFYEALKAVYGPSHQIQAPLRSSDGSALLTDKEAILQRWSEHAQSNLLQRAPRRKARSWCSKKALQRSAEETACTGGNQPSVMAAGGLRPRQLALISEKSQL